MFGKRGPGAPGEASTPPRAEPAEKPAAAPPAEAKGGELAAQTAAAAKRAEAPRTRPAATGDVRRSENFYDIKSTVFTALIDTIDLSQLARLDQDAAREEIRDIVNDII